MASNACSTSKISFKTKHGSVSFVGRKGGSGRSAIGRKIAKAKFGNSCGKKPEIERARSKFLSIGRACAKAAKGKGKAKFNSVGKCVARAWA